MRAERKKKGVGNRLWKLVPALLLCFLVGTVAGPEISAQTGQLPNIVFINTDDGDRSTFEHKTNGNYTFENIHSVARQGVSFDQATFAYPLCCPNRAVLQRGQYPHNTGVLSNNPPDGGFESFRAKGRMQSTYGVWLNNAGYTTGYFGKYMNGYDQNNHPVPPGWDRWFGAVGSPKKNNFNADGDVRTLDKGQHGYHDVVVADRGIDFIKNASQDNRPFLAVFNFYAPHWPAEHPAKYDKLFRRAQLPKDPSFSEQDVSDKPLHIRKQSLLGPEEKQRLSAFYRDRLRSVEYVDRAVGRIKDTLMARGELENTIIVFWTDNGFHLGQHRLPSQKQGGKQSPYSHDANVPMFVQGPGIVGDRTSDALVSSVDVAVTFGEAANADVPAFVDGRNFLPVARGETQEYRPFVYLEGFPRGDGTRAAWQPNWQQIRTPQEAYHRYNTGEEEVYDLLNDPYQLDNLMAGVSPPDTSEYHAKVNAMKDCDAQECRDAEEADYGAP